MMTDTANSTGLDKRKPNQGNLLIAHIGAIAEATQDESGHQYLAFKSRPHEALPHDGPRSAAMIAICQSWMLLHGQYPNNAAKSMASDWLAGECSTSPREQIVLRVAQVGDHVYIDPGWDSWEVIHVTPTGWSIDSSSPVRFCRSSVTGPMADPRSAKPCIDELRRFIRIDRDDETVLIASLLLNWLTECPQALLVFFGGANVGKSLSQQFLLSLVDPSTVEPGNDLADDPREFKALASVRRTLLFDNASFVAGKTSDLLARVLTGGELVSRSLYTNDSAHITTLKRPVWLNGIMSGFSRSDLASRAVKVELQAIPEAVRVPASDLQQDWELARAALTHALLDLLVTVLQRRSDYGPTESTHRNGDLIRVVKVLDDERRTSGLAALNRGIEDLRATVIDSSSLATAINSTVECVRAEGDNSCCHKDWREIEGQWVPWDRIRCAVTGHLNEAQERKFPEGPKAFGEALMRVAGDIDAIIGVSIEKKRFGEGMRYRLTDSRNGQHGEAA